MTIYERENLVLGFRLGLGSTAGKGLGSELGFLFAVWVRGSVRD